jgi:hypothetical protein
MMNSQCLEQVGESHARRVPTNKLLGKKTYRINSVCIMSVNVARTSILISSCVKGTKYT